MIKLKPSQALDQVRWAMFHNSDMVHTAKWQSQDISGNSAARMVEVLHYQMRMDLSNGTDIESWQKDIPANYPWAEDHFKERVCGAALNPGIEWQNWPWADKADSSRNKKGQFNHNYMERYWPKQANDWPTTTIEEFEGRILTEDKLNPLCGIRGEYGDLDDLIFMLANEPDSRQAYLPVWFPEDTGILNKGRKPCTLGYHFIMRNGRLDVTYHIRSCDYFRHFDDDVYLTIRLAIHVLQSCRMINPEVWGNVKLGELIMNITSLHMFLGDYHVTFKQKHPKES
ncbi:thymidylate synthase [Yersinia phage vB_YenM_P744]